jgi:putative oxygen-independent coproporphyrinogen III oxidase
MTRPPTRRHGRNFGIYLHIPFCAHKCDYCAFATWTDRDHLIGAYLDAVAVEIERATDAGLPAASSVFVGGGTPSLVDPKALGRLIGLMPTVPDAEITVECNPESVTIRHAEAYAAAGVNRISLGVQSLRPEVLAALGRRHDEAAVGSAVAALRAGGIDNLNVDLIYGGTGESLDDWRATLDAALGVVPDHVSAYALTVEPGTPLAADPSRHPDDDDQAAKYEIVTDVLGAAGYEWYEISNWARPGRQCRHNLLYWSQGDYRGFGCAAHSHEEGRRWWNVRTPERYIEALDRGETSEAGAETLDAHVRRIEGLQLALRTQRGVPSDALSAEDAAALDGLVEPVDDRLILTRSGRLLANEVAVRLR